MLLSVFDIREGIHHFDLRSILAQYGAGFPIVFYVLFAVRFVGEVEEGLIECLFANQKLMEFRQELPKKVSIGFRCGRGVFWPEEFGCAMLGRVNARRIFDAAVTPEMAPLEMSCAAAFGHIKEPFHA